MSEKAFKVRISRDCSITEYHSWDGHLSSSMLSEGKKKGAMKAIYNAIQDTKSNPDKARKRHYDFGNAFEMYITDKTQFYKDVYIYDEGQRPEKDKNFNEKKNKAWKAELLKKNADKYQISAEDYALIQRMEDGMYTDKYDFPRRIIEESEKQISIWWQDKKTGVLLKCRPDLVRIDKVKVEDGYETRATVVNIKTDKLGSPSSFAKSMSTHAYPFQAEMEMRGVQEAFKPDQMVYLWLVFCKDLGVVTPYYFAGLGHERDKEQASIELQGILERVAECYQTGYWGGYNQFMDAKTQGIMTIGVIPWYWENWNL